MVIQVVLISSDNRGHCGLIGGIGKTAGFGDIRTRRARLAKARGCVFWREIMICFGKRNVRLKLYRNISPRV